MVRPGHVGPRPRVGERQGLVGRDHRGAGRNALPRRAPDRVRSLDEHGLDAVAEAFAEIIDAKSPFTYKHSSRVADIAVGIARQLGLEHSDERQLYRASLLHDMGKLGVSNRILDKPGKLTAVEMREVRKHPSTPGRSSRGFRHFRASQPQLPCITNAWTAAGTRGASIPKAWISVLGSWRWRTCSRR